MVAKKPLLMVWLVCGGYILFYIFRFVILSIISNSFPSFEHTEAQALGFIFIFALGIVIGIAFIMYAFPEISQKIHENPPRSTASPLEVLMFVSTDEEKMVIEAVNEIKPKAYKFEVARKTGLSRMKVHRITTRLADRGVLLMEKNGRYSQLKLAEWVK